MSILHFLLTPDRSSARWVRRMVAENSSRLGVMVGTWTELVEAARKAYVLPDTDDSWNEKLAGAAAAMTDSFWAKSLEVAQEETLSVISSHFAMLIEGAGLAGKVMPDAKKVLPDRARKHLADLAKLNEAMVGILPARLAAIKDILNADKSDSIRTIILYRIDGLPMLSPWQKAMVEKLEKDNGVTKDIELAALLISALTSGKPKKRPVALAAIQDNLFIPEAKQVKLDNSVQWLAVRDYLEEAEVAAGLVQKAIKDKKLKPSDIGLLIPSDTGYAIAVQDAFRLAGIPLSGLNTNGPIRDLGREAVLYFLLCRRTPAPVMALTSLFTSPLMPWSMAQGYGFAKQAMKGNYRFNLDKLQPAVRGMLALIRKNSEKPAELAEAVTRFVELLDVPDELKEHGQNARAAGEAVAGALRKVSGDMPWKEITSLSAPKTLSSGNSQDITREGVAVLEEDEEPWRSVQKLIILGFESGRYPAKPGRSSVFSEEDLVILKSRLGYDIASASETTGRKRELLRRQFSSAESDMIFLIPNRDTAGKPLQPSASLTFMSRLFKDRDDPQKLLLDLDTDVGRASAQGLSIAPEKKPVLPRELKRDDLSLGQDLLKLRKKEDGTQKPESPSYIETLIISPLGWFLERNGLVPSEWAEEELDPASKGTLAHEVFENLFVPGEVIPDEASIRKAIPGLLNQTIVKLKPMLLADEWRIEYRHLEKEIETAALRWREFLAEIKATIVGSEVELFGTLDKLPLHGKTDLLISLPNNRMFVVDYKKSKSKKRRIQMDKGWDSQTSLYRVMLKTGGVKDETKKDIVNAIKTAKDVGVLYYMMNDQTILADTAEWIGRDVARVEEMGPDISQNAMKRILERIQELRKGVLVLNRENDDKNIEKETGMTAKYALEKSPLVQLFVKEEEASA